MIDSAVITFNIERMWVVSLVLGFLMFAVALGLTPQHFKAIRQYPRSFAIGLGCQYGLLPVIGFAASLMMGVAPSVALGMLLVCSCPGGNVSNFYTYYARGNAALSISLSAVSTMACLITTPILFFFWGNQHPDTALILRQIELDPVVVVRQVLLITFIPCLLGMGLRHYLPIWAMRIKKPVTWLAVLTFVGLVLAGLLPRWEVYQQYLDDVLGVIVAVNLLALTMGYWVSRFAGLNQSDRQAVAFEVGIQNSGFGLVLGLTFFPQLSGLILVCAVWGIWHLLSGFFLAQYWRWRVTS